jgi:hypothetical protein
MGELLSYRCENAQAVGAIVMDVAEAEVADVVETNEISALQAWKNMHRMKRDLLLVMLVETAVGGTDVALAVAHMEEVVADSLGH